MTDEELQALVSEISIECFQRPFRHKARFNPRLRTTGGRYMLDTHHIEINPKQYEVYGREALISIIKHELCHYHLHLMNKGYRHRDKDFKELLKKVGGARYCQVIEGTKRQEPIRYSYRCKQCQQLYLRKRKVNVERYVCGKCHGELIQTHLKSELANK